MASKMSAMRIVFVAAGKILFVVIFENLLSRSSTEAVDVAGGLKSKYYTAKELVWKS